MAETTGQEIGRMAQYIEVVRVTAPAQAQQGTRVDVTMRLKNSYSAPISVYGVITPWDGTQVLPVTYLTTQLGTLNPGATMDIGGYFTMPGVNVTVQCWSYWYGEDGVYHFDDEKIATVALQPVASGTIIARTINYDGISAPIPSYNIPQGTSVQLRVKVRNDMPTTERLGIGIVVWDPAGNTAYTYSIFEDIFWGTRPGESHEFVARPDFILEKAGEYHIWIGAYVYPEEVVTVDTFQGTLCTVVPQEIPTGLKNTSLNVVLDYYDYFDPVPYVLSYDYQGRAQSGTLLIELGTGLWPFFTPEAAIDPVSYSFPKRDEYTRVVENRTFTLPDTIRRGQTYSARVTLRTADGVEDKDTDYTALRVKDPQVPATELRDLDFTIPYGEYNLGHTLPVSLSYRYKGVAQSGQISVMIGKGEGTIFSLFIPVYTYELKPVSFTHADSLTTRTADFNITLPHALEPGHVYSVKIRMETVDKKSSEKVKPSQFKIDSTAVADPGVGQYRVVKDYAYPAAETYVGQASQVTYEFTVPMAQLEIIGDWISRKVIDSHEEEVEKHGSQMLHLKVSERDRGLTSKDYLAVATATAPKETAGQEYTPQGIVSLRRVAPLGVPLLAWVAIIGVILIVLGFTVQAVIKETSTFLWGEDGVPPTGFGETITLLLAMGLLIPLLGMMQEQTREMQEKPGAPKRPKPYTEAALKAARGAVKLGEKGIDKLSKEVARIRDEKRVADEEERRLLEKREQEKQAKLREAQEELRKRREERDEIERWF